MSRAPLFALLVALAVAATIAPVAAAAPRDRSEDQADAAAGTALLPKAPSPPRSAAPQSPIPTWTARSPASRRRTITRGGCRSWTKIDGSIDGPEFCAPLPSALVRRGWLCAAATARFRIGGRGWQRRAHPGGIPARRPAAAQRVPSWRRRRPPACPLRFGRRRSRRPAQPTGVHGMPAADFFAATPTGTAA